MWELGLESIGKYIMTSTKAEGEIIYNSKVCLHQLQKINTGIDKLFMGLVLKSK